MAAAQTLILTLGSLTLDLNNYDANGFLVSSFDPGYPPPRVVANDLPGQDGSDDQTAYFSARTVVITGSLIPSAQGSRAKAFDALAPFLAPGARPTLMFATDSDTDIRCLDMRVGQWTNPIDHPTNATAFSVQWVCPNPIAYDQTINEVDVAFATGSTSGRTYPRIYPLTYPTGGSSSGEATVVTGGTYASWPILRIFGPCANPSVIWLDPVLLTPLGPKVVFNGLTVADGHYVEVDTRARTALLDGVPGSSQYNFVNFANTTWGPLQPGANLLQFAPASASTDSLLAVRWRDSYL